MQMRTWAACVASVAGLAFLPVAASAQQPAPAAPSANAVKAKADTGCAAVASAARKGADSLHKTSPCPAPGKSGATRNQSQSGVTNSSGASTLGPGVTTKRPDQGQPVMAKGDTLRKSPTSPTK